MYSVRLVIGREGIELDYESARCTCCVISTAFPESDFDAVGLCAYCRSAKQIPDGDARSKASALGLIEHAAPDRSADVIVLFSGGKDSTLALLTLLGWGLRVIAFTLDNGFMSLEARENVARTIDALPIDHLYLRPGGDLMKRLYRQSSDNPVNREALKYSTSACGACISVVLTTGAAEARRRGVPLLAGGWTPGQFTHDALVPGSFLRSVCDGHLKPIALRSPAFTRDLDRIGRREDAHFPPLFNPLYCSPYNEDQVVEQLAAIGWRRPSDTDSCSSNCLLNGYLVVDHALKYGYHPYEYELAHHVRTGQMDREAAVRKMRFINVTQAGLARIKTELGTNVSVP
jgi:hypothetical protein